MCSTRATRSPPPPFLPSLTARRRVYRPTFAICVFRRLLIVPPTLLHSLDSLSLPLSLAPTWVCPPTGRLKRRNQGVVTRALRGFLLVPDVLYSLDPNLHRSPDVLHLLDSLSLPFSFSLSLAPTRACPPTDRPNNATTASLLAPSEASSSFPTCLSRLTHASTVPTLEHPQVGVSTVRSSSVAFLSFHFPCSLLSLVVS